MACGVAWFYLSALFYHRVLTNRSISCSFKLSLHIVLCDILCLLYCRTFEAIGYTCNSDGKQAFFDRRERVILSTYIFAMPCLRLRGIDLTNSLRRRSKSPTTLTYQVSMAFLTLSCFVFCQTPTVLGQRGMFGTLILMTILVWQCITNDSQNDSRNHMYNVRELNFDLHSTQGWKMLVFKRSF